MRTTLMLGRGRVATVSDYGFDHITKEIRQPAGVKPYCVDFNVAEVEGKQKLYITALYDMSGEDGARLEKKIRATDLDEQDGKALGKFLLAWWNLIEEMRKNGQLKPVTG